ncbi:MAG: adenylate/guanylate cyclase domain-containing protein [Bacteroidetes bacterium]|nr:adenylate/guanylate cyclase domain-containing protein [Bacteroidota bacterium]MBU1115743.1 adenylate/guanylate cyclase domain-containing protein [Bacteroidota bacterium]MBU1799888.1 adenylate/guanylate cyclase domain-containing protein [Bacteroidota bacterium]
MKGKYLLVYGLIIIYTVVSVLFLQLAPVSGSINRINKFIYDLKFNISIAGREKKKINDIVIIDLDEKSIQKLGRYSSWPIAYYGEVVNYISEGGAKAIAFDMFFTEADSLSAEIVSYYTDDVSKKINLDKEKIFSVIKSLNTEKIFADALHNSKITTLGAFDNYFRDELNLITLPKNMLQIPINSFPYLPKIKKITNPNLPIKSLSDNANSIGFGHISPDDDGTTRHYEPMFIYDSLLVANFSFQLVLDALEIDSISFTESYCKLYSKSDEKINIPIDEEGRTYLNFYGVKKTFRYISFSDIIQKRIPQKYFKDKIVFVGSSAIGLHDLKTIPIDQNYPGVELHATFVHNALHNEFIRPINTELQIIVLVILVLISFYLFSRFNITWTVLLYPIILFVAFIGDYLIFSSFHLLINFGLVIYFSTTSFIAIVLYRYKTELQEKMKIKKTFGHYLPSSIMNEMLNNPEKLKLGGEYKNVTALFTDIKGFTSISENVEPSELTKFLKEYMTELTSSVFKNEGMLDKYIGDAIVALFGVPLDLENHAQKACIAAIEMRKLSHKISDKFSNIEHFKNLITRIGINTGDMITGNMGSEQLFDYTGIGDNMNLAARLEALNKYYNSEILISEATRNELSDEFIYREIDNVAVKGKEKGVRIFELIDLVFNLKENELANIKIQFNQFNIILQNYYSGNWKLANENLGNYLEIYSSDLVAISLNQKIESFNLIPPINWSGVFKMESK